MLLLWIVVIVAATLLLFRKRWGAVLFGVGANSVTAELSGINVKRFRMFVYAICGAISAFAGLMILGYTGTPYLNLGAPYLMTLHRRGGRGRHRAGRRERAATSAR